MDDINLYIDNIHAVLRGYKDSTRESQRRLEETNNRVAIAEVEYKKREEEIVTAISEIQGQFAVLKEELVPLEKEKKKLELDLQALVERKSELMIANSQLEEANRKFKVYEVTAIAALEAKESELETKENQLNQKLGLQNKTRILPPR